MFYKLSVLITLFILIAVFSNNPLQHLLVLSILVIILDVAPISRIDFILSSAYFLSGYSQVSDQGVDTLPNSNYTDEIDRKQIIMYRTAFFLGEANNQPRKMTKGEQLNYNAAGGDMILISIKTKDGLTLEGAYMKNDRVDVKTTMTGGFPGRIRASNWFRNETSVNTILASRRGQDFSQGSSVLSGEMGVYYDTQAIISYLLNEKGIAMKDIWFYGYCQGSFYAVYAATHFHQIGGVIIDRGIPDYFMMAQKTYSVSEVLYSKVFPSGLKDELPLDPLFIEPDVPFITNGMSNIKRLDACIGINIAPFFFMYGSNDMVINYKQVQALIYSYFNGEDLYFDRKTCKFKSLNAKVTRVHNLKIDHFINFMQLEHQSLNELKRFVEDTINDGSERVNYRVLEKGGVSIKF